MALVNPTTNVTTHTRWTAYAAVRAASALTTSYVASNHTNCAPFTHISVLIAYVYNSATSIEWYVEWSHDATTWYRSLNVASAAGTNTITVNNQTYATTATINLCDGNIPVEGSYVRVQIKRSGGAAADTAGIVIEGVAERR